MITTHTKDTARFEEGLVAIRDIVASTIGPDGCNVSLAGAHERHTWDDGYKAILKFVPEDPMVREGVFRVRDAAKAQVEQVGDGTSTCTLLLCALYKAGVELARQGVRRREIVREFARLTEEAVTCLEMMSMAATVDGAVNADLVKKVATIAMHGDAKNGDIIGGLVAELGPHGMITVERSATREITTEKASGYSWREGVLDPAFFNQAGAVQFGKSLVVLVAQNNVDDIQTPFWNKILNQIWPQACQQAGEQLGLVLICDGAAGNVMGTFANPKGKDGVRLPMLILRSPGYSTGDSVLMLEDLARITGATVFRNVAGVQMDGNVTLANIGMVDGVRATLSSSTLALPAVVNYGTAELDIDTALEQVIEDVDGHYADVVDDKLLDQKARRLAALTAAIGIVRVPMASETGNWEYTEALEDGYRSAMAAVTDGVLPGGGKALIAAAHDLLKKEKRTDILQAFCAAILEPGVKIMSGRADISKIDAFELQASPWHTVDLETGRVGHAVEIGVLDSKKVVVCALRNAASVALPLINTDYWLVTKE